MNDDDKYELIEEKLISLNFILCKNMCFCVDIFSEFIKIKIFFYKQRQSGFQIISREFLTLRLTLHFQWGNITSHFCLLTLYGVT